MMYGGVGAITVKTVVTSGALALVIWTALFALQGVGISAMAKNRGIGKRYLAFCLSSISCISANSRAIAIFSGIK